MRISFSSLAGIDAPVSISICFAVAFLSFVLLIIIGNSGMFLKRHGQRHALNGLCYFLWMIGGLFAFIVETNAISYLVFDTVLGILGVFLALTAAFDFQHKNVTNIASGTLDEHATVTYNEMIEHSFYQGVNLVQVLYLHAVRVDTNWKLRCVYLFLVTSPWLVRSWFPINRFSDNYNKVDNKSSNFVRTMYRIKKYQYVFYKHFLLHGLNLSVALYGYSLSNQPDFRLYWMLLNLSYVMEFFLQTLVKKKYIKQATMLNLQILLMTASTIAALYVLQYVSILVAILSLLLNFLNRNHDVANTMFVLFMFHLCSK